MPEPLKNCYSHELVNTIASYCKIHHTEFEVEGFVQNVLLEDWQQLELKQRMHRIAEVLGYYLPNNYQRATKIILRVATEFSGLEHMCFPDFIEQYGQDEFEISMSTLKNLTEGSTAEFAIRPFIVRYPKQTMSQMLAWSQSSNKHVRRLASEGCRPRLPWAMALPKFKQDPTQVLSIILNLINDPSLYVRRSVANNLNDISKDHPEIIVNIARQHLGQSKNTDWVIKHACRGLLKQGHKEVLSLFGYTSAHHTMIDGFKIDKTVKLGERVNFEFAIKTESAKLGKLRLEFVIDFMKANGKQAGKIFKISEGEFPEQQKRISKYFSFKPISTRKYYPGSHSLSLVINGEKLSTLDFELLE